MYLEFTCIFICSKNKLSKLCIYFSQHFHVFKYIILHQSLYLVYILMIFSFSEIMEDGTVYNEYLADLKNSSPL